MGRRGHTPVVRVRGRSWRRWSIAAMCCYKPGETSRLIYRPRRHRKHKGKGRDTFAWSDYRDLVVRAHIQLQAPIVLIWDDLDTHRAAGMREYVAAHDWLTIVQLPSYAPDLNPVEGVWSLLQHGPPANTAFTDDEHLERTLRRGLRHIQLRPDLIDGCLTGTGLTLTHRPTTTRRDEEEAVAIANGTRYGLTAAVWTQDVGRAVRLARSVQAGQIAVNTLGDGGPAGAIGAPFGGYKHSGFGRSMGPDHLEDWTQVKCVVINAG